MSDITTKEFETDEQKEGRAENVVRYHAKRLYKSMVEFHQDWHEAKKKFSVEDFEPFAELDFPLMFDASRKLAGINYRFVKGSSENEKGT